MTHRLEAAAAAASKDLYDDPETGGTLDRRRQERGPTNESRREGESIPLNNLGNSTEVDEGLYSTPDEIPGLGNFLTKSDFAAAMNVSTNDKGYRSGQTFESS